MDRPILRKNASLPDASNELWQSIHQTEKATQTNSQTPQESQKPEQVPKVGSPVKIANPLTVENLPAPKELQSARREMRSENPLPFRMSARQSSALDKIIDRADIDRAAAGPIRPLTNEGKERIHSTVTNILTGEIRSSMPRLFAGNQNEVDKVRHRIANPPILSNDETAVLRSILKDMGIVLWKQKKADCVALVCRDSQTGVFLKPDFHTSTHPSIREKALKGLEPFYVTERAYKHEPRFLKNELIFLPARFGRGQYYEESAKLSKLVTSYMDRQVHHENP